ncbi:MAG: nucleotidyltransferase family protein [Clostridia bacterium]|nr:nucleotidyltransferase family protein [Clostridia bacterium]
MYPFRELFMALIRMELSGIAPEDAMVAEITPELIQKLYVGAKTHDMGHMIGASLQKLGLLKEGDPLFLEFRKKQFVAAARCQQTQFEFDRICGALEEGEIDHLPLKGSVIRPYYPDPAMRTSCDIDILIRPEDLDRAVALLGEKLEYELKEKLPHDYSLLSPAKVHLELHFTLLSDEDSELVGQFQDATEKALACVWEVSGPTKGYRYRREMPMDYYYAYLLAHAAKHVLVGGCGIRPFMDIWVIRHCMGYDLKEAAPLVKACGLTSFAESAEALSEKWFSDRKENNETADELALYILQSGAYGNIKNKVAGEQVVKGNRFVYILSRLFRPYSQMKYLYPVLHKWKILLPFFEVYRWFDIALGSRRGRIKKELNANSQVSREDVKRVRKLFGDLNL